MWNSRCSGQGAERGRLQFTLQCAVEAKVAHKLQHLAALAQAELRDVKARQNDLEKRLQDSACSTRSNAVITCADDASQCSRLSEDERLPRTCRLTAAAAVLPRLRRCCAAFVAEWI